MATLASGAIIHGFEILSLRPLSEFQGRGIWARHLKTGLQVYHLQNAEEDNLFSLAFKTPPRNSTGVSHILEHTVLCGSERFPVKDPFLLLLKGSMHTYMNAFTFPDKTVYPASSQVEKDFYNLFSVYGDAVFFPLLRKEAFLQEGHRREIDSQGKLGATGIVFNEMKGNYSSHDSIAAEWAYRSLFEDSPYAFDSGGEPEEILSLGYEEFLSFHRAYYNPSNCFVFFFGNLPTERHLEFLDTQFLSRWQGSGRGALTQTGTPIITPSPRWRSPRRLIKEYPAGKTETVDTGSSVTLNWLLGQVTDPFHVVSFEVLTEILLGHAGSPLEKALIESGLGEDLSPATGIETETLELAFSVGLRGTSLRKEKEIEDLIFSVFKRLSKDGIERDSIEGAMRRVEFRNREVKAGASFGMRLMRRSLRGWIHGEGPEHTLEFHPWMERLKETYRQTPSYFEGLIQKHLLENPYRTTLIVLPSKGLNRKFEETLKAKLQTEAASFSEEDWKNLQQDQEGFRQFQALSDTPEALQCIPNLQIKDIPTRVERIPSTPLLVKGAKGTWGHDLFTNGIVYLDMVFDLEGFEDGPYLFLPLFANALSEIGAGERSYDQVALDLQLKTGGFGASLEAGTLAGGGQRIRQSLFLRLKTLEELLPQGLELIQMILQKPDFRNNRRIKDILQEYRNAIKSSIIPNGSSYVASRVERGLSLAEAREEQWKGISQFQFVHSLEGQGSVNRVVEQLEGIWRSLFARDRVYVNFTSPQNSWDRVQRSVEDFLETLPHHATASFPPNSTKERYQKVDVPRFEGLVAPSTVGFVAWAIRGSLFGTREFAHEAVLSHLLSTGYLWEKIRMQGGAYGAGCTSHGREEIFSFSSYRDPQILPTLTSFRQSLEHTAREKPPLRVTEDAVIGTVAKDMRPLSPSGKSIVAFKRILYGIEDSLRERHLEQALSTTPSDLQQAAERLIARSENGYASIIASRDLLEEAAKSIPSLKEGMQELPL